MKKKYIFVFFIISFFSFNFFIYSQELNQKLQNIEEEISGIRSEISEKKSNLSVLNQNILDLDSQIGSLEAVIVNVQSKLDSTQKEINNSEKKINDIKDNISLTEDSLSKRVKVMSKTNEMSYVKILLTSADIEDFISTLNIMKKITSQDKKNIEILKYQKETLDSTVDDLKKQKINLSSLEQDYSIQNNLLLEKRQIQNNNIYALESDLASLEEMENLKIAESKALTEQIKQMALKNSYSGEYSGLMSWPTSPQGTITSYYGNRIHPILNKEMFHSGIDIALGVGNPILSASDGKVIFAGDKGTYGRTVIIDHGSGITTLYAHCSAIYVNEGQSVSRGENIAAIGSTGRSTGPHLHFEVRYNGITKNPLDYI